MPAGTFWPAEDYHQKYHLRGQPLLLRELQAIYPNEADFVRSTAAARINGYLGGNGTLAQLEGELPLLGLTPEAGRRLRELVARRPPPRCQ